MNSLIITFNERCELLFKPLFLCVNYLLICRISQ